MPYREAGTNGSKADRASSSACTRILPDLLTKPGLAPDVGHRNRRSGVSLICSRSDTEGYTSFARTLEGEFSSDRTSVLG